MDARTLWWLVFLALITRFACYQNPFVLEDTEQTRKATEGSCVEIKCKDSRTSESSYTDGAHWFWLKNPEWNENKKYYTGTVIYSTNQQQRPVSPDFENRVTFTGSSTRTFPVSLCSIMICNLNKTDSGNYSFRFEGKNRGSTWITKPPVTIKVEENKCPITFEQPAAVKENGTITLTCSTLLTCDSELEIKALGTLPSVQPRNYDTSSKTSKATTMSFIARWQNDGDEFACQTAGNTDQYLIRKTSIVVLYAPRETSAKISSERIKEGDTVTLTCSSKGQPNPVFTWFRNEEKQISGANWTINSIQASENGSYYCEAKNDLDEQLSNRVFIDVEYAPNIEVRISKEPTGSLRGIKQGDEVTLTCVVKRGNPPPKQFSWVKGNKPVRGGQTHVISSVQPEDRGVYKCTAWNSAGAGTAEADLQVQYKPRRTGISTSGAQNMRVRVNSYLKFTCNTDANPDPYYSWYKQIDSSQWIYISGERSLTLERVHRTDETCYRCNATNIIDTGENSKPACIKVLFPPTKVMLSMDTEVTEGQVITINCTAESYPPSYFTITRSSSDWKLSSLSNNGNIFHHTITASSTNAGRYTCEASNGEGNQRSQESVLVVKYTPKDVKIEAQPNLTVKENTLLKLLCRARSYPKVISFTWMMMTDGGNKSFQSSEGILSVQSAGPSDRGQYSCIAMNEIGDGRSQQVTVEVKYVPKHTTILKGEEQQRDGKRFVTLYCSTRCYPEVKQYFWYRKTYDKRGDERVSKSQNLTVYSDKGGEYYCVAQNDMGQKSSEPIRVFDDILIKAVKYFLLICLILLITLLIVFLYRHRRNKSNHRRTTQPSCGFLGWQNGVRTRNLTNETALAEPFRSRDDLLPEQPCRPNAQRCQPRPDSTPAPNINTVYTTVNLPSGRQAPSAPKPKHEGYTESDSLNYASLHFDKTQRKPEEDVVYAKVSKAKASNELAILHDYENVSPLNAAKPPDQSDSDTETSDDEVEVSYSQVNFKPKPGHLRSSSDSTSSEEETQYSQVKA